MATASNPRLSQRYGKRRPLTGKKAVLWLIAVLVVVGLGFLIWAAFGTGPEAEGKTTGYQVVDSTRATVSYQVTKDPGRSAKCELQALDKSFGVVGWKIVDIPASPDGPTATTHTEPLNTDAKAVSADVENCWVD